MRKNNLQNRQDLCQGPFLPKIIRHAVPIILTGVLQLLFNAADLVVVGQFEGNEDLGAVGATGSLISLLVSLFMGLSVGAGVGVARGIGAKDWDRVKKTVHTAIPAAVFGGAVLTVVGITLSPMMLTWLDTPPKVMTLAVQYMRIYFAGISSILLYNFGAAILRSAGDTKSPLIFLSAAGVANVLLNLFFVAVCKMSVAGVALATTLSQTLSAFLVLRALCRRTDACRLEIKKLKVHWPELGEIVKIGLPAGLQSAMFSISNVTIQSAINSFGDVVLSGSTAASNIEGFVHISMNAIHHSATTFVGQNSGAGKYKNVLKVTGLCLLSVTVVGVALGWGAYALAPKLLPIYLKEGGDAVTYGIVRMGRICFWYFLFGLMDVLSGCIRGMGNSLLPMIVSVLGVCCLRIVWVATVFAQYPTLECLFAVFPISWAVTGVVLAVCCVIVWRQRQRTMVTL